MSIDQTYAGMEQLKVFMEYQALEQVEPFPGNPRDQPGTMVGQGMCQAAVQHKEQNRVIMGEENEYINAIAS